MFGAMDAASVIWTQEGPLAVRDLSVGVEVLGLAQGDIRRRRITRTVDGSRAGVVWLHGASWASVRCLHAERIWTLHRGVRSWRQAKDVMPGMFIHRMVDGILTVDPVVATTTTEEAVPAVLLEIPNLTLLSEEGVLCRPSRQ